jgi:hypothetical protein
MSAKTVFTCALVLSLAGFQAVRGQAPAGTGGGPYAPPGGIPVTVPLGPNEPMPEVQIPALSSWILNPYGPIRSEFFVRGGFDMPVGGGKFTDTLSNGWTIAGGIRTMFYNTAGDAAWAFELGVLNTFNHGKRPDIQFPLSILVPPSTNNALGGNTPQRVNFGTDPGVPGVTTEGLNRTYLTLGFGREWYADLAFVPQCWRWRFGIDGGGRYGSESLSFNEIRHRTDTIAALYAAIHSDIEIPINCGTFFVGLRLEYAYTWADVLQDTTRADVQDINLMLNAGIRF